MLLCQFNLIELRIFLNLLSEDRIIQNVVGLLSNTCNYNNATYYPPKFLHYQIIMKQETQPIVTQTEQHQQHQQHIILQCEDGPYGKMKLLCQFSSEYAITIGPNYCFFFIAWSLFLMAAIGLIFTVFHNSTNPLFQFVTLIICVGQPLSYLMVALSDPGIVRQSVEGVPIEKTKYCNKCQITVSKKTYHCMDCELCIDEYDHHCPWVSKCIGKNNLIKFYVFLAFTPLFLFYTIISFAICTVPDQPNHIRINQP